jgi:NAD(P)H dehydrogenase (quinone)
MKQATLAVTGTNGAQGGAIAQALTRHGHEVRPIRRQVIESGGATLQDELRGAQALIITSPIDHRAGARESQFANLTKAARAVGVSRLVLNTAAVVHERFDRPVSKVLLHLREMVMNSGVDAVSVEPTVYLDNLIAPWSVSAIVQGGVLAYPAPEDAPIAWISHSSLAGYVLAALEQFSSGSIHKVAGPHAITGLQLAKILGDFVGREVGYERMPLEAFAQSLDAAVGAPAGQDIGDYYRYLVEHPDALSATNCATLHSVQSESAQEWAARQKWR